MGYQLGVDLGTTYTAAAVVRHGRAEIVPLGDRAPDVPSVLFLREDGEFLVGEAAVRRGPSDPGRLAREFKRRLGDPTSLLLAGTPLAPAVLMAKLLHSVVDATSQRQGGPPDKVVLTHPANWGTYRTELLEQVARVAEVGEAELCPEPTAAVLHFATTERVEIDDIVCVYDLGGGTFDAAVLRKTVAGFELLGSPEGIEHLGGVDFDASVLDHVTRSLGDALLEVDPDDPATLAALTRLRSDCVSAKEALSRDTEVMIPVTLGSTNTSVRLTRPEFEDMVRPAIAETIACLRRALSSARIAPEETRAVVLVGGSARIPLVASLLASELGRPVTLSPQPKQCVALGAALFGSRVTAPVPAPAPPAESRTSAPPPRGSVVRAETPRGERIQRHLPRGYAAAATGLAILGGLLALVPTSTPDQPRIRADLSKNLRLPIPPPATPVTLELTVGGVTLGRSGPTDLRRDDHFDVSSADVLAAGPVHATVTVPGGGEHSFVVVPTRAWFKTVPGAAVVLAVMFVAAYAESLLRPVRRGRPPRVAQLVGMALVGGLAGVALDLAAWAITKHLLAGGAAVAAVLALAAAGVCLALAVAGRGADRLRTVPRGTGRSDRR